MIDGKCKNSFSFHFKKIDSITTPAENLGAFQNVAIYFGSKESVNCRYNVRTLRYTGNKNVSAP